MVELGLRQGSAREFAAKEESNSIRCSRYSPCIFYHVMKMFTDSNEKGKLISLSIAFSIEGGRSLRERSCEQMCIHYFGGSPTPPKVGGRV